MLLLALIGVVLALVRQIGVLHERVAQVGRLPHAVLLDEDGILRARGLINSREHLESLFEAKRLGVASIQDYFARKSQLA